MNFAPKGLEKVGDEKFRVTWEDGHVTELPFQLLRQACPCAVCRDEFTGASLLDPATIPADLKATKAELMGNYAVAFLFSDGHSTGIFTFETLRGLCPCSACRSRASSR